MSDSERIGALVLACLHLRTTPEREEALRMAAARLDADDWDAALVALEAHGILGLARRHLGHARIEPSGPAARHLEERAEVMQAIDHAFRLTLERFLAEAARAGLEVTLLKGASLALDLYPRGGLRAQGDLDLLVDPRDVAAGVAAAQRIGLGRPDGSFPVWWYRLAHFHLKLQPRDSIQREIELHWHLHPPALLHTVRLEDLRRRRRAVPLGSGRVWTLDRHDRFLHLVTHLRRHAPPESLGRVELLRWARDPRAPLRMKWLLDVRAEVEADTALDPAEVARRAAEWNAEADLAGLLSWMDTTLGFAGEAAGRVRDVLARLPEAPLRPAPTPHAPAAGERPLRGLDLRPTALHGLPRWIWPPASFFERAPGSRASLRRRLGHAVGVLARTAFVAGALPVAWLARAFARPGRGVASPPPATLALELAARTRRAPALEEG